MELENNKKEVKVLFIAASCYCIRLVSTRKQYPDERNSFNGTLDILKNAMKQLWRNKYIMAFIVTINRFYQFCFIVSCRMNSLHLLIRFLSVSQIDCLYIDTIRIIDIGLLILMFVAKLQLFNDDLETKGGPGRNA